MPGLGRAGEFGGQFRLIARRAQASRCALLITGPVHP
jgi:hypothetical protein